VFYCGRLNDIRVIERRGWGCESGDCLKRLGARQPPGGARMGQAGGGRGGEGEGEAPATARRGVAGEGGGRPGVGSVRV